jgi:hypothetical protein
MTKKIGCQESKKPYKTPRLKEYGKLKTVTKGSGGTKSDAGVRTRPA